MQSAIVQFDHDLAGTVIFSQEKNVNNVLFTKITIDLELKSTTIAPLISLAIYSDNVMDGSGCATVMVNYELHIIFYHPDLK